MVSYRNELLNRLVAMEHEALDSYVANTVYADDSSITGIDAYPYVLYQQATTPYIVHRIGRSTESQPQGWPEDSSLRDYDVHIRVVIGHVTGNYVGRNEEVLYEIMPLLEDYLSKHRDLTTNPAGLYPDPQDDLFPTDFTMGDASGLNVFPVGGIDSQHVGEEILLRVPIFWTTLNS